MINKRHKTSTYQSACLCINVTNRILLWAAAGVIIAAGGCLKRTASPTKAVLTILIDTAACGWCRAGVVIITNWLGLHRGRRRWARFWRVHTSLCRIRWLHCYSTLSCISTGHISLQPNVTVLTPVGTPWIPNYPIIFTIFSTISNSHHTMV